ncbi:DEAD/DEAH box helicase [Dictyobacter sp. S3.2.2.5]|uniref:DEAD/DEAH box helicase n=1 Tax=Dictyobacter halimunensis TaxID=3026934 RepID=A0ABQ6G1U1_9CHLR|nr:DEAD/DEAH box helicase [Dictyobacter sp. S3.2.2.5]
MTMTTINPVYFASQVNKQFLDYQLTAFPLTDPDLATQARTLLRGEMGRSPLIQGPYVSLSKAFEQGRDLRDLAREGLAHPALPGLTTYPSLFAHQDEAYRQVKDEKHCLIATGTGSGKTESFLYPILDHCLHLRDDHAPEGIVAVLVYPMNALALDQLGRLRQMLVGSGISFGMYVGTTAASQGEVRDIVRLKEGDGRAAYEKKMRDRKHEHLIISPYEERLTEQDMVTSPPRILLTNINQLELLLTRGKDLGLFVDAPLKYLVFDEAHTYTGAIGAEVSCLIRRLRAFCSKSADDVICIGTSATVTDLNSEDGEEAAYQFAHRFFGVDPKRVALVREHYQQTIFPSRRHIPQPPQDSIALLDTILQALEHERIEQLREAVKILTGRSFPEEMEPFWPEALYEHLKHSEYIYALFQHLDQPLYLQEAAQRIQLHLGRKTLVVNEQTHGELLCYLALGAAAEKDGSPLLRPKVHYFLKGLEGAVLAFARESHESGQDFRAKLHLSLAEAMQREGIEPAACPTLLVCQNCGQHYLEGHYREFLFENGKLYGGLLEGDNTIWPLADDSEGGQRVLFTNRFASEIDADDDLASQRLDKRRRQLYFCHYCGTLHLEQGNCQAPMCKRQGPLVPIWIIQLSERGKLQVCPSCGQRSNNVGERVIEPIKPLRAITVADVHILAQNMVNALEGPQQKLIVFSDNRQDAAFQAGWMQDHARRYRLRHLIYDFLRERSDPSSITDIREYLLSRFHLDRSLARVLAPEVFSGRADEAYGKALDQQLSYYLHIMLMREWTTSFKQRDSLETWGKARVVYYNVSADHPWIQEWAQRLHLPAIELAEGISSLLDAYRRNRLFYDSNAPIFSRYWREGDDEVQRGYLPFFDFPPKGLKFRREEGDREIYVVQFQSERGQTLTQNYISKWNLPLKQREPFMEAFWSFLIDGVSVLKPVELIGARQRVLPGSNGVFQLASTQVGFQIQHERYRCNVCQRVHTRIGPNAACTAMHCKGTLQREEPPVDDYNVAMLDMPFSMLTAQEHSAQVPPKDREKIEEEFKKADGRYNCLVATPTLEMGVDIGALDMVLLRNVPPKPSNYWQRAGRAGRRHRMAVVYTYCRRSNHDSYFFEDPARMLSGRIETPRFNLHNEVMLRKHVHAAVLSELLRLSHHPSSIYRLNDAEVQAIQSAREQAFPNYIATYLFEDGNAYRQQPYQVTELAAIIERHLPHLLQTVQSIFAHYWPAADQYVVRTETLELYIRQLPERLQEVIERLHNRLLWAINVQERLLSAQLRGLLEPDEDRMLARCKRYLHQLAQHDINTYALSVLAVEGFLPGYGTYETGIKAFASRTNLGAERKRDFELTRIPMMALREYVPGNLIYANGGRFKVALYHFPIGERQSEMERYRVNIEQERIREVGSDTTDGQYNTGSLNALLTGLPICDVDLSYISRISDEEANRFQLPVAALGYLKQTHRGGYVYTLDKRELQHRFGQHIRLVNVGPADRARRGELGYPICTVCGAVRSPYASDRELEHFLKIHKERCGREPENIALTTDSHVDGVLFQGLQDREAAVNFGEAVRIGAAQVLEMESQDLQLLLLPQSDGSYHLFLYDPMPGGSGLLQQLLDQWDPILESGTHSLSNCESHCKKSCYNCMRTYRNVFYHDLLDRYVAIQQLQKYRGDLKQERELPPLQENATNGNTQPTNRGEQALAEMILQAGLPGFEHQHRIDLGKPLGATVPDLFFDDPVSGMQLAIYLDGLSKGIHGNDKRQQMDRMIRESLEMEGVDVLEIAASDLDDPEAMKRHLKRISMKLRRR